MASLGWLEDNVISRFYGLQSQGKKKNKDGSTPLHFCAYFQNKEATKLLLEHADFGDLGELNNAGVSPTAVFFSF